jgi:hypothetical protein
LGQQRGDSDQRHQVVLGQVYYGWQPKPGLWLLFRDAEGQHRRLCLSSAVVTHQGADNWQGKEDDVRLFTFGAEDRE